MSTFRTTTPLAALAAEMLADEVQRLTHLRPQEVSNEPTVDLQADPALSAEGYRLGADGRRAKVFASSSLGFVFGVGALLADCWVERDELCLPTLECSSRPQTGLRGMWMANHRQSNSYYEWRLADWERYVRSLMLWGMNCLGAYPTHMATWPGVVAWGENAGFTSRERQREWEVFWQTQIDACLMAGRLGLPYHIWIPPNDIWPGQLTPEIFRGGDNACPSTERGRRLILENREEVFRQLPHVDVFFVPSHDNGGCPCPECTPWVDVYLPLARDQAARCRRYHPEAKIWLSTQHLSRAENEVLYRYLRSPEGEWVDGVAFGPWSIADAQELRENLPERVVLVNYPDITHALRCQNPIRGLDYFISKVFERDGPSARPRDMEEIWQRMSPYAIGSLPYSEGVHDDLNKAIWLQLGWDANVPVRTTVERYCRRWCGGESAQEAADLLYELEENWKQPLLGNEQIPAGAERLQTMVDRLGYEADWRVQMFLARSLIECYIQQKLPRDQGLERELYAQLATTPADRLREVIPGALEAMRAAMAQPVDLGLRDRIMQAAGRLQQEPQLRIDSAGRLGFPMNDVAWVSARCEEALAEDEPAQMQARVQAMLEWEHPGPGGYFDDGGNPAQEPHLVLGEDYVMEAMDPDLRHSQIRFAYNFADSPGVIFEYAGLDPQAAYRVRVTYVTTGRMAGNVTLAAGPQGELVVHEPLDMPQRTPQQYEFPLPPAAYAHGRLRLSFTTGGKGRGPLVPELWLIKG